VSSPQIECNDTCAAHPSDRCIHELFEDQAERSPDSIAAAFHDRRSTYRELNVRASRLAHALCRNLTSIEEDA
jgi:non-ribosomal peptide synthetase component F